MNLRLENDLISDKPRRQVEQTFATILESQRDLQKQFSQAYRQLREPMLEAQRQIEKINKWHNLVMEPVRENLKAIAAIERSFSGLKDVLSFKVPSIIQDIAEARSFTIPVVPPQGRVLTELDYDQIYFEMLERGVSVSDKNVTRLFVDRDSKTVYRSPKDDHSYKFESDKRILLLLSLAHTYKPTESLMETAGYMSKRTVTTTIQKIRSALKESLNLDFDPIEGEVQRGYRLSPQYTVLLSEDFSEYGA